MGKQLFDLQTGLTLLDGSICSFAVGGEMISWRCPNTDFLLVDMGVTPIADAEFPDSGPLLVTIMGRGQRPWQTIVCSKVKKILGQQ